MPARRGDEVHRITTARTSLSEDQSGRTRRYLISMAIRTVCFIGAIIADGWLRWALVVGALVLPYVAVIVANAGRENDPLPPQPMIVPDTKALGQHPADH